MSVSSGNVQHESPPGGEEEPFQLAEYSLRTADGMDGRAPVEWTVTVLTDGHRIVRHVRCGDAPWGLYGQGSEPEDVIWPAWPARITDEPTLTAATATPLEDVQNYWTVAGNRLRDSAKWMATVLGAALAALIGTSPLAVIRQHRPQPTAIGLGLLGLLCLGATLVLVLQVMRPQSVSYSDVQNAKARQRWLPQRPLYKWQHTVENEQDLYLPTGVRSLTDVRQSMIIEEITLMALATARATARDQTSVKLCEAQTARAARLMDLRAAAARIATIGEYYELRGRSTRATYAGVLLGLLGTAAIVAAFAWPPS